MALSDGEALAAAAHVAHQLGEHADPKPMPGEAIHPVFRAGGLVIRIEVSELVDEIAVKLDTCDRLARAGIPYVVPATRTPIEVPGADVWATAWRYEEPEPPIDWQALGQAISDLHAFSGLTMQPEEWLPDRLRRAIDDHPALDAHNASRLHALVPLVDAQMVSVAWSGLPLAPSHGDLWVKNVIPRGPGRVALCDLDFFGIRPRAFDLGVVYEQTKGDERWQQFIAGYGGHDVPSAELLEVGFQAAMINWTVYVLERRQDWLDYTEYLAVGLKESLRLVADGE